MQKKSKSCNLAKSDQREEKLKKLQLFEVEEVEAPKRVKKFYSFGGRNVRI
jgi:hypothetical protein